MPIKAYNPTTNGRRGMTSQDFSDIGGRARIRKTLMLMPLG